MAKIQYAFQVSQAKQVGWLLMPSRVSFLLSLSLSQQNIPHSPQLHLPKKTLFSDRHQSLEQNPTGRFHCNRHRVPPTLATSACLRLQRDFRVRKKDKNVALQHIEVSKREDGKRIASKSRGLYEFDIWFDYALVCLSFVRLTRGVFRSLFTVFFFLGFKQIQDVWLTWKEVGCCGVAMWGCFGDTPSG